MKRVLFILNDLDGGGAERVFVNIANGFVANGIKSEFLLGKKKGVYLNILNPSILVSELCANSLFGYIQGFYRFFKKNEYTHIFTASTYPGAAAVVIKKVLRLKSQIYLTHHYSLSKSRPIKYWAGDIFLKFIHFFITPHADKIIAVSYGSLAWLRKFSHHKLSQGICIYNPVFDDTIYSLAKVSLKFPVDVTGKLVLLNAGRLVEQKDHLTLLHAFKILKQTYENAILFILGQGPLEAMLKNFVEENDLSGSIIFMGFEPNPYKWMSACNVFILSSIYEGFGNVIVEAMALGKTVVSTNCPSGPAEILQDGKFGYLCNTNNPIEMSQSIIKAIQNPMDENILSKAVHQYRSDEIVKQYIATL